MGLLDTGRRTSRWSRRTETSGRTDDTERDKGFVEESLRRTHRTSIGTRFSREEQRRTDRDIEQAGQVLSEDSEWRRDTLRKYTREA